MSDPQQNKVVIVAGQRFSVPAATDNESVRQQLLTMGFADVANADVKKGKDADGTETIEFIKKAGTKGADVLTPAALAEALRAVPAAPIISNPRQGPLLRRLVSSGLTCAEALDLPVTEALNAAQNRSVAPVVAVGGSLCRRIDQLPATADRDPSAW